jgi:hypothetical protein
MKGHKDRLRSYWAGIHSIDDQHEKRHKLIESSALGNYKIGEKPNNA